MKKIYALIPAEREKECSPHHFRYTGKMPCTGPRKCYMCGIDELDIVKDNLPTRQDFVVRMEQMRRYATEGSEGTAVYMPAPKDVLDLIEYTSRLMAMIPHVWGTCRYRANYYRFTHGHTSLSDIGCGYADRCGAKNECANNDNWTVEVEL